jgi:hypothetical protein
MKSRPGGAILPALRNIYRAHGCTRAPHARRGRILGSEPHAWGRVGEHARSVPSYWRGRPGTKHALTEFVSVSRAGNAVARSTRKLLVGLYPDQNGAWNTEKPKLADRALTVEATGSVKLERR